MPKWTEEQKSAISEVGKNIIVSAGAGSGKTAVLSERVLEHVKKGINVDDLLILTFTNAAAAEMKERIRKKIKGVPELKNQLDKIDIAYITTFDAYALSTVKRFNNKLNISNKISIIDASIITIKKEEILDQIFEEYYEKKDSLFLKLINDFCLKDDKEIYNAILSLNNKLDNLYNKDIVLNTYIDNYYNDVMINKLINEYVDVIFNKINSIKNLLNNMSNYIEKEQEEKMYEALLPLFNANNYEDIKRNSIIKLPIFRGLEDSAKLIKNEISNILKEIVELTKYNTLEEIKNSLYSTKDYVTIIIELIKELDKRVFDYKKSNNAYEFIDISKMAIKILKDNEDVRLELKNKYKEILIDEYQDTNDLQDIFISLIENNNVYMVGDIKQSIYRFRNANPLLFKSKYEAYQKNDGGFKIDLNRNFRSRSEVLDNINLMFNLIMDEKIGGADYLASHQMIFGLTPYNEVNKENYNMNILHYEIPEDKTYSKEEIEIFTIARDIKNKIDNKFTIMDKDSMKERLIGYSDFVILMDRSSSFSLYKKIFEYLNIPLTIYRDSTLSDSVDISIIKNIYNLIICVNNKDYGKLFSYSYMAVARSYLFNIPDNEILKTIKNHTYSDTPILKIIYKLVKDIDILTNQELYDLIIKEFNFYERIIYDGNVKEHIITIDSIGKIVSNASSFGYSPKEFLEYLNKVAESGLDIKLSLNKEASDSVKIMTIHTSKGLEYPICYFSGLYKKFNIDDLKNKFYYDNTYGFITPYIDKGIKNSIVKVLLKNKYMEEEISEKLRLFYVGLTRAREQMIMVGNFTSNELAYKDGSVINDEARLKYLKFNDMINSVYPYIKKYITNIDIESLGLTKKYNLTKKKAFSNLIDGSNSLVVNEVLFDNNIVSNKRLSKNIHELISKDESKNIELGLKMHYLFEITDFNNPDYSDMSLFERECISKFIDTKILDNSIDIYKEYEFMYKSNNELKHGIIDLLIIKEDKCIIVDYKLLNTTDKAYLDQLKGYKEYISYMMNKDVYCYLYSIIDSKLVSLD